MILLNLLQTTWAQRNVVDCDKLTDGFYGKLMEAFEVLHLGSQPFDKGSGMEREERRRSAIASFVIEQWTSLFMFRRPTTFNEEILPTLMPLGRSPKIAQSPHSGPGIPQTPTTAISVPPTSLILNNFSSSLQFDKDTMYMLFGQVADFQTLDCCTTALCESCGPRQRTILAKFDTWFEGLLPWVKDFDKTGKPPEPIDVQGLDPHSYTANVTWVGTMLQMYHSGVLNLLRPRKGSYTLEWCLTDSFVMSTEHAIRACLVIKTVLVLNPTYKYSAPFVPYSLLQTALVHRCYVDYIGQVLGPQVPGRGETLQTLLDEAKSQLAIVLNALQMVAKKWIGGQLALAHFAQNIPL